MRLKPTLMLIFAASLMAATLPVHAQVSPAANQGGIPIVVGAGFSNYSIDWGPGQRMDGVSAWADYFPNRLPPVLDGLGIEIEGREIDFARPAAIHRLRQDTGMGGAIYDWNRFRNFRPYGKFLAGIGSLDFPSAGNYSHDTFLVLAPGGGVEYRAWRHIWIRGDYEYQYWQRVLGPHDLTPTGFTIGASYDFRSVASGPR
jgi:opacity protein-like surface antigen